MASELRVFVRDRCIVNPPPSEELEAFGGLVAMVAPKLIEMAIGGAASLLKKAGEDKTVQASGSAFTNFYVANDKQALSVNTDVGAVLAVYGAFDGTGSATTDDDDAVKRLREAGIIGKDASVEIIFEAAVRPSDDGTAFHLDTRCFKVFGLIGDSDKGERDFAVTLTVTTASATVTGDTIALGTIDLGTHERDADLIPKDRPADAYPQFRSNLMPWGQITAASKAAYDADVAAGQAGGKEYMPVTFTVTVSQTQKGHPFLARLGELLDGAKKDAATALSKVLPEERARAESDRAEAAEKLYVAELDAELAVREAQKAYDDGEAGAKPALRVKLEQARRKRARAVALREAAGLPARDEVPPQ